MSLKGNLEADKVLRGRINRLDVVHAKGDSSILKIEYGLSTNSLFAPTKWSDNIPTMDKDNPYLWIRVITESVIDGKAYGSAKAGVIGMLSSGGSTLPGGGEMNGGSIPTTSSGFNITNVAVVGQTIKISAVDENGKPTAWEAVDFPTDEYIEQIVAEYMKNNATISIGTVNLLASKWVGNASPYKQVVTIPGVTAYSQVDLTPTAEQLSIFHDKDLAFVTENENGIVTVYAIGDKPQNDYTIQVTIKEVSV